MSTFVVAVVGAAVGTLIGVAFGVLTIIVLVERR